MNYSITGVSSVFPGVGHFLLFPAPHGEAFVAFHLYPGVGDGGSGFTLTGALVYYILVMLPNFVL